MQSMPLATISLVFFFLFTVSHALYIFTDLNHLHNVDDDADDDYRGTPKIQLPSQNLAAISGNVEEDEAARFGDLAKELRHIPAAMRLFPRQCHHNPTVGSDVVEVMMRRSNGGGLDHVTGRLRTRGGPHAARLPGADVEERGGVMMMMLKRPHFSTPSQQAHRHEKYQHREAVSKRAVGKKRQDRQEEEEEKRHHEKEIKETENAVLKKIRKFMANF